MTISPIPTCAVRLVEGRTTDREWLRQQFAALTTELQVLKPSEWAEEYRQLPAHVTPRPGYFSFDMTPYMREILDNLGIESQVLETVLMKAVQIGGTTAVLENAVGYVVAHVSDAPMMLLTADAELARLRLDEHILPMLQHSGLSDLICSSDEGNNRKTGKTEKKIEWAGGGYLLPFGAQNANKLRSVPIRFLFRDEIDGYPDTVGKDGDPIKLSTDRTAAYERSRKILDISTPLIKGRSKIEDRFLAGDQRYYYVRCLKCGLHQRLRFRRQNPDTGEETGIVWELDGGRLIPDSVRYLCKYCGHPHRNEDKTQLFDPANGAEWRPTAAPSHPYIRSYHLSALYSPVGMQTWAACVQKWLDAWDLEKNQPKDNAHLQTFYNNVLGESFEIRGERVKFATVSTHRRAAYSFGKVPNKWAQQFCGSPVLFLTCTVDVHSDDLSVAVHGWCRDRRCILIDYWRLQGETEQLDNPATWKRLEQILEEKDYEGDDGKRYRILIALIDSGFRAETVYRFCSQYADARVRSIGTGVYPVKGREAPTKGATAREFSEFIPVPGQLGFHIVVDWYKDQLSAMLRRQWDGMSMQPAPFFNAPIDATDAQLKELTVEVKRERIEKTTGKRVGFEWHRPSGAKNELWDLTCYASCAHDIVISSFSKAMGFEFTNYAAFYTAAQLHSVEMGLRIA
jgi:phage terminase large subunit GpA-like protein